MSLFQKAAEAGLGFIVGASAALRDPAGTLAWAAQEAVYELSGSGTYSFTAHMEAIAAGLNIPLAHLSEGIAIWLVPVGRLNYGFSIQPCDGQLLFIANSQVRFRRGRLPKVIVDALSDRNSRLEAWQWDVIDGEKGSYFIVRASGSAESLTPASAADVMNVMVAEVAGLDSLLEEKGFVGR